jgi:hypothetical protein
MKRTLWGICLTAALIAITGGAPPALAAADDVVIGDIDDL